jgi:hypothetical protein
MSVQCKRFYWAIIATMLAQPRDIEGIITKLMLLENVVVIKTVMHLFSLVE